MYIHDNMTIKWKSHGVQFCALFKLDDDADLANPRQGDRDTVMACFHPKYTLGDDLGATAKSPEEFWREMVKTNVSARELVEAARNEVISGLRIVEKDGDRFDLCSLDNGKSEAIYVGLPEEALPSAILEEIDVKGAMDVMEKHAVWLPLWLYDHSGLSMSCGAPEYYDQWDSSMIGWIVYFKPKYFSSQTWREDGLDIMQGDVAEYNKFLEGDIWSYTIYESVDGAWDEIDYAGGFLGDDLDENGMLDVMELDLYEAIMHGDYEEGEAKLKVSSSYEF